MTTFRLSKWAIKKIDKIRQSFLWKGSVDSKAGAIVWSIGSVCNRPRNCVALVFW